MEPSLPSPCLCPVGTEMDCPEGDPLTSGRQKESAARLAGSSDGVTCFCSHLPDEAGLALVKVVLVEWR